MRRSLIIAASLLCTAAVQAERPQRPTLVYPPKVAYASEPIVLQVRIEPHPQIRTVLGEMWELRTDHEDPDGDGPNTQAEDRAALRRSSWAEVEEGKRIYVFEWRAGVTSGRYHLVGKILIGRGITLESPGSLLVVP